MIDDCGENARSKVEAPGFSLANSDATGDGFSHGVQS